MQQDQNNPTDVLTLARNAREEALLAVMQRYGITLPRNAPEWRVPTEPTRGSITGIAEGATLVCTDGIVGWFRIGTEETEFRLLFGHLQHFVSDKPAPRSGARRSQKSPEEKALELLRKLQLTLEQRSPKV